MSAVCPSFVSWPIRRRALDEATADCQGKPGLSLARRDNSAVPSRVELHNFLMRMNAPTL
jgi:hypothetical protein